MTSMWRAPRSLPRVHDSPPGRHPKPRLALVGIWQRRLVVSCYSGWVSTSQADLAVGRSSPPTCCRPLPQSGPAAPPTTADTARSLDTPTG
jgi:hypothetical protein